MLFEHTSSSSGLFQAMAHIHNIHTSTPKYTKTEV